MMGPYYPAETPARLIKQLEKGREFAHVGEHKISNMMLVYKGINLLEQTSTFNKDIRWWRRKNTDLKTWATFKKIFHQDHREQRRPVTTSRKGGYAAAVKKLWCTVTPTRRAPQGDRQLEHYRPGHADVELQYGRTGKIQCSTYQFQLSGNGQIVTYDCDNEFQASAAQDIVTEKNEPNKYQREVYCWICGRNYTPGSTTWSTKKMGHK